MYMKLDLHSNMMKMVKLVQLMTDKKAIILNARGGIYSTPEAAPMEMAVNYMRNVFGGVFGMEIVDEVIIEGHAACTRSSRSNYCRRLRKSGRSSKKFISSKSLIGYRGTVLMFFLRNKRTVCFLCFI